MAIIDDGDSAIAEITHYYWRLIRQNLEMTRAHAQFYVEETYWAGTGRALPSGTVD